MEETKTQSERFLEAARAVGADESDDALDRIMGKLDILKRRDPQDQGAKNLKAPAATKTATAKPKS